MIRRRAVAVAASAWALVSVITGTAQAEGAEGSPAFGTSRPGKAILGSWVKVVDKAAFSPRDTSEDVVFAGKMWLSNAWHSPNILTRDLWTSTDGVTWTRVSENTPYDGYSELVGFDGKMWAIKSSVGCSTNGVNWKRVLEKTPFGARGYGEAVVFRGRIWQLGSGEDVWNTADGVNWTCVTKKTPYGNRAATAVVAFDNKLWVLGGRTHKPNTPPEKGYKDFTTHNDVWCSADGAEWTRVIEHSPWAPRQWHIAKVYRDRIWVIGGHDNVNSKNFGDVWTTKDGKTWTEFKSPTRFSPRHEVTAYVYDDSLWVVAGNSWPVTNDVWRLTLAK